MKKSVLLVILFGLILLPLVSAQLNDTQINNGFTCLNNKIGDCTALSTPEQIFSSLATGKCTNFLSANSNNCWPSGSCDIKTTAQAVLALNNAGLSTSNAVSWLASKQMTSSDIQWYLQIDSVSNSSCTVSYPGGSSTTVTLNQDKTLSNGAGNCLTLSSNNYWLSVSPNCYGTNFTISCNKPFTVTNLYQRQNYPTIYVSSSSNTASSNSKATDTVNSSCFGTSGSCSYESTLWATLALNSLNKDISPFLPYLTVMASDSSNQQYLPYSFLYALTSSSDYLNTLLSQQVTVNNQNYWDLQSNYGPYYDTALALLPLQSQTPPEKTSALDWLGSSQGSDGCWGNIVDTSFVLYSVAGSKVQQNTTTDCLSSGNYCLSGVNCQQAGGNVLQGYSCGTTIYVCCSKNVVTPSCSSQGGQFCSSSQTCQGNPTPAGDTASGQTCCIGTCTSQVVTPSDCEVNGGVCRTSCLSGEQASSQNCALSSNICCVQQQQNLAIVWIFVLGGLILLLLLGLVFRKKLRVLLFRTKTGFKGGPATRPGMPPRPPPRPPMSFQRRPPMPPPQRAQRPSEVNDVLKKLREIGK